MRSHFNGFHCLLVRDSNQTDAIHSQDAVTNMNPAIQVCRSIRLKWFDVDSTKFDTSIYSTLK